MTVTVTIPDENLAAFEAFLATQVTVTMDNTTHVVTTTPHYDGIEGFVKKQIADVVTYVAANFTI
jgi:hypothetical protein